MKFSEYKEKIFKENPEVKEEYDKLKQNEIIDFERKGNLIRFYLGENGKQWGDDWDDAPYEHNADRVYDEYVKGQKVIVFHFDDLVLEPCCGVSNSSYSKEDMINRRVACIIVVPYEEIKKSGCCRQDFAYWATNENVKKIYFGDTVEDLTYVHSN